MYTSNFAVNILYLYRITLIGFIQRKSVFTNYMAWSVNNTLYIFGSETAVLFDSSILLMNIFYSMNTDNSHVIMPFFVCSLYHCILIGTGDKVLTWHFMDLIKPISSLVCYYLWLEWFICHQKRIDYNKQRRRFLDDMGSVTIFPFDWR